MKNCPPLSTDHVQQVETDNAKLKRQIEEQKQAREDAEKKLRDEVAMLKIKNINLRARNIIYREPVNNDESCVII